MIFKVSKSKANLRLDQFLKKHWPQFSRSFFKKLIQEKKVLVNKTFKKPDFILKEDSVVEVKDFKKVLSLEEKKIPLDIVYEDKSLLVINKPAGLSVHPTSFTQKGTTLVNALIKRLQIKEKGLRPGIVHRLDKDTSGLMVIAKTKASLDFLQKELRNKKFIKKYFLLVYGKLTPKEGEIKIPLSKVALKTKPSSGGAYAETHFKVKKYFNHSTLVEATLITGKTHQLRVHFASIGYPIMGDDIYAPPKVRQESSRLGLKRQFLHSFYLAFVHPVTKKRVEFSSPLPYSLKKIINQLKFEVI